MPLNYDYCEYCGEEYPCDCDIQLWAELEDEYDDDNGDCS